MMEDGLEGKHGHARPYFNYTQATVPMARVITWQHRNLSVKVRKGSPGTFPQRMK